MEEQTRNTNRANVTQKGGHIEGTFQKAFASRKTKKKQEKRFCLDKTFYDEVKRKWGTRGVSGVRGELRRDSVTP
jgi:hypothetical protein